MAISNFKKAGKYNPILCPERGKNQEKLGATSTTRHGTKGEALMDGIVTFISKWEELDFPKAF